MKSNYTQEEKIALITRYHKRASVSNLCFETGIPRSTLYSWIDHFSKVKNAADETIRLIDLKSLERQLQR